MSRSPDNPDENAKKIVPKFQHPRDKFYKSENVKTYIIGTSKNYENR